MTNVDEFVLLSLVVIALLLAIYANWRIDKLDEKKDIKRDVRN